MNAKQSYPVENTYIEEVRDIAEIPHALNHLEKAILYGAELIQQISSKIDPVLSPDLSSEVCNTSSPEKIVSDLASRIKRFERLVTEGNAYKISLLNRIEL